MWTRRFWKATAERAVKSAAQGFVLLVGADVVFNALQFDWENALGVVLGAGALSVATSLASSAITGDGPSLTNDEVLADPGRHRVA
jgi:hypothetical protein